MIQLIKHNVKESLPEVRTKVTVAINEERCSAYLDVDGIWYDCLNGHACREIQPTHWIEEKPVVIEWNDSDIEENKVIRTKGYFNKLPVFQINKKFTMPNLYTLHSFDLIKHYLFTGTLTDCKKKALEILTNSGSVN